MKMLTPIVAAAALALTGGFSGLAPAANNIDLVYNGPAVANTRAAPANVQAYTDWCAANVAADPGTVCVPTVQQPVYDMATGQKKGHVYIWGAFPFHSGPTFTGSICFSEFMVFALEQGDLHVHSGPNGTCGAGIDPALKAPKPGADYIIAGGGDGVIAGGTGKYKNWTGTFTDRVFVGFSFNPAVGVGGIVYYDQLLFSISGK